MNAIFSPFSSSKVTISWQLLKSLGFPNFASLSHKHSHWQKMLHVSAGKSLEQPKWVAGVRRPPHIPHSELSITQQSTCKLQQCPWNVTSVPSPASCRRIRLHATPYYSPWQESKGGIGSPRKADCVLAAAKQAHQGRKLINSCGQTAGLVGLTHPLLLPQNARFMATLCLGLLLMTLVFKEHGAKQAPSLWNHPSLQERPRVQQRPP